MGSHTRDFEAMYERRKARWREEDDRRDRRRRPIRRLLPFGARPDQPLPLSLLLGTPDLLPKAIVLRKFARVGAGTVPEVRIPVCG